MSKVFTSMELANALQVHPSTITYWVETNKLMGTKDATGKLHFTEEQVMQCLLNRCVKDISTEQATLYIIDGSNEDEFNQMIQAAFTTQKKVAPKSVRIESIDTFLLSSDATTSDVNEKDFRTYEDAIKAKILREISRQLKKYVYSKIQLIGELDERYGVFTLEELKSLILNDADKDLIERFDAILEDIRENPTDEEMTVKGLINANYTINNAYLGISLEAKLSEIAKSVGIADNRFLAVNARQLLGYNNLIDEDTCKLLADKSLKIDVSNPFVSKAVKEADVKKNSNTMLMKIKALSKNGYYYIVKYLPENVNTHQGIYNLLDNNNFKNVVYMGKSKLADQLSFKINSQISKGQIKYLNTVLENK